MRSFAVKHLLSAALAVSAAAIASTVALGQATPPASAPAAAPTKIAVINLQAAIATTKDGQAAAAELDKKFGPKKDEMGKRQQEIKDLQDKLQRGGNTLSQSAKDDLQRQVDQKTRAFNYDMQDAEAEVQNEQRKLIDDIGGKMVQIIDKYAQSNGYAVVIDDSSQNSPLLWASASTDITKDVIEIYDKTAASLPTTAAPKQLPTTTPPKQIAPVKPTTAPPKPPPAKP